MSDEIRPALTPEEWGHIQHGYPWNDGDGRTPAERAAQFAIDWAQEGKLDKAAAAALHGQPFGFTREDVEFLREVVFWESEDPADEQMASSLAIRIAALLPREE